MGIMLGYVSKNDISDQTTVKGSTKNRTLPQVLVLERIELLMLLALLQLMFSTITKKMLIMGVLQID